MTALDPASTSVSEIVLTQTLKSAWKTVPRIDGRGLDILTVRCSPDLEGSRAGRRTDQLRFVVRYGRYTFEGGQWMRRESRRPGFWENEGESPPEEQFP